MLPSLHALNMKGSKRRLSVEEEARLAEQREAEALKEEEQLMRLEARRNAAPQVSSAE